MSALRLPPALTDRVERREPLPSSQRHRPLPFAGRREPLPSAGSRQPLLCRTVADVRAFLAPHRRAGKRIGLVPTMGALHDGHLSLIEAARRQCDVVAVSIFVNPKQFDEQADLAAYPRHQQRDFALAEQAGADVLFVPSAEEIYKPGFQTIVQVDGLTDSLEGAARGAAHFAGVCTVCTKLFNILAPHVAYFGQKDAQQVAVIGRLVADLDIDLEVQTLPTVREPDGLAMSSRNARLTPDARERALALVAALRAAQELVVSGERASEPLLAAAAEQLAARDIDPDYVALVNPDTFAPLPRLQDRGLLLLAARVGGVRLIDNLMLIAQQPAERELQTPGASARRQTRGEAVAACSA